MPTDEAVTTLGAAIVITRKATSVGDIRKALEDARWILSPRPADSRYKAWQTANGEVPSTPEQDSAKKELKLESPRRATVKLAGHGER